MDRRKDGRIGKPLDGPGTQTSSDSHSVSPIWGEFAKQRTKV